MNCKNPSDEVSDGAAEAKYGTTLLIYMCASDLETNYGSATKNIAEMCRSKIPAKSKVVLQTGGAKNWKKYDVPSDKISRYEIKDKNLVLVENKEQANMGESSTLFDFLSWGIKNYPNEQYGLIFWNHGGGALEGVCFDENFDRDSLALPEIKEALSALDEKFEFVGFDACLMANIGTALVLEPFAKKMIASEENVLNGGWDYENVLNCLGCENFYPTVLSSYAEKSKKKEYYTLSCIELENVHYVAQNFLNALKNNTDEYGVKLIIDAFQKATKFGSSKDDYYDIGNIIDNLNKYNNIAVVEYVNGSLRKNATGLSVYFPINDKSKIEKYKSAGAFDEYAKYIDDFLRLQSASALKIKNYGEKVGNQIHIEIDEGSMNYFREIKYVLYLDDSEDCYEKFYFLGDNCDFVITGNNVFVTFNGLWFDFNGKFLRCESVDAIDDITFFEGLVQVDSRTARLLFAFDSKTKNAEIFGISYQDENYSRIHDLEDGMKIIVAESLCENVSYMETVFPEENAFSYRNGEGIKLKILPDHYYQYTIYVIDIFGEVHPAGTAIAEIKDGVFSVKNVSATDVEYPKDKEPL